MVKFFWVLKYILSKENCALSNSNIVEIMGKNNLSLKNMFGFDKIHLEVRSSKFSSWVIIFASTKNILKLRDSFQDFKLMKKSLGKQLWGHNFLFSRRVVLIAENESKDVE